MRRVYVFIVFLLVALAGVSVSRRAFAQAPPGDTAAADDEKRKGDEAMVALRYQDALDHYQRAYDATKSTALLYNMGRAYEGLGEFPKALDALEGFNEKAPADLKARVPKLEELLADVRSRVATLVVSATVAGAEVRLGEHVVGQTRPGQIVLRVNAGKQHLTIARDGFFPFEKDVTLAGGKVETVDATLASRTEAAVLRIASPVTGASVAVDGNSVGVVPAEAVVTPGSHRLFLRRDGYDDVETRVVIGAGEKKDVSVPMAEHQTLAGKWWFWTAIGVVVVAGVVTGVIAATTEKSADTGTIAPGRVKAEGLRFSF